MAQDLDRRYPQLVRTMREATAQLRASTADPQSVGAALVQLVDSVESLLRRVLRDDMAAPMPTRLSALAADELDANELLDSLRSRDRISIESASLFHDLANTRRRLLAGAAPAARDIELASELAPRLERELDRLPAADAPTHDPDETLVAPPPAEPVVSPPDAGASSRTVRRPNPGLRVPAIAAALLLLVLAFGWLVTSRRGPAIDEGIVLFRSGAYTEAEPHFRRYAEANPADPTPRLYLARIYRRMGDHERAAAELRAGLQIAPDDAGLQRELGFLLLDTDQPDAAAERFRSAVAQDPGSNEGWLGLVRALRESGRPDAAERILDRAPAEVRALLGLSPSAAGAADGFN